MARNRRTSQMRTGKVFMDVTDILRKEIQPVMGRKVSDREITDGIGNFLLEENLLPHMTRNVKRKKRGLF